MGDFEDLIQSFITIPYQPLAVVYLYHAAIVTLYESCLYINTYLVLKTRKNEIFILLLDLHMS